MEIIGEFEHHLLRVQLARNRCCGVFMRLLISFTSGKRKERGNGGRNHIFCEVGIFSLPILFNVSKNTARLKILICSEKLTYHFNNPLSLHVDEQFPFGENLDSIKVQVMNVVKHSKWP